MSGGDEGDHGSATTESPQDPVARDYWKRRLTQVIYPALLNAAASSVVLLVAYGLGTLGVVLAKAKYGVSHEVVRAAVGWLAILYALMIVVIALQTLLRLSAAEATATIDRSVATRTDERT